MSIAVFIATGALNRLMSQMEKAGIVPDVEGRLGRSDYLHACYSVSIPGLPAMETADSGRITIRAPMEGLASVPWGMGMKYHMEAVADIRLRMQGRLMHVDIEDITFEELRLGNGCPMPRKVLDLLAPFLYGLLFRGLGLTDNMVEVPAIMMPLSRAKPDAPPLEMRIMDVNVSAAGITILVGMEGDSSPPARLPDPAGWDLTIAVCEGTGEDMAARVMEVIGNIEGVQSFTVPDSKQVADLVLASAETLTTFGRKGLGRRTLRSASTVEVSYRACLGRPNLSFGEGERIILCKIPAHVCARADLVVENPKGGMFDRLKAFFHPSLREDPSRVEKAVVTSWDIDADFTLERAEVTVVQKEGAPPRLELSLLDLEMDLPWPLPNEILEKIAERLGREMISARLPDLLSELPLPSEIPFKIILGDLEVSTCRGKLAIQANLKLVPSGDPEEIREILRERIKAAMPTI